MSVLIKGMEMPDKCGCCKLFHAEYPMHCTAIKEYRTASAPYGMSRPDWCPLVEIKTPHGRLIEEPKKLEYGGLVHIVPWDFVGIAKYFYNQIHAQPTVIEAEEDQLED